MTNNNGRVKIEMSQAELRMYKSLKTLEGQRMLKQFEQEVQRDKVQLAEYRSQLNEIKGVSNGTKWMKDANKETIRKIDNVYHVVKTDEKGSVKSIDPVKNGMKLSHALMNELKEIDQIDYQMFQDGVLQNTQAITRETYETRNMLTGMPLDYTTEYALRTPVDGKLPRENTRMLTIKNEYSVEGRKVAKQMESELDNKISALAQSVGE
ncbi:hypothetical protein BGM25_06245 [Bacillus sp. FJAT-29953]|nr:hypothetical protein [Bacillus sp. FJAT-29953]